MSWNYRVIRKTYILPDDTERESYAIHEVYYDNLSNAKAVSANALAPLGRTIDELKADLEMYMLALDKPVLDYDEFEGDERS